MLHLRKEVSEIANSLHEKHNLSDLEALQIAVKIQQNRVLSDALGVTRLDNSPKFLEGIAIALGYNNPNRPNDMRDINR